MLKMLEEKRGHEIGSIVRFMHCQSKFFDRSTIPLLSQSHTKSKNMNSQIKFYYPYTPFAVINQANSLLNLTELLSLYTFILWLTM